MEIIRPPKLNKGDLVGVCSPSNTIAHKREVFEQAKNNFEQATGLKVAVAPHAFDQHYYSGGTQVARLADLHGFFKDPKIKAIIFSVGGDTAIDLVDGLDYDLIRQNPKIVAGISDATTLLSAITAKTGLLTFLGLEFLDFARGSLPYTTQSILKTWFDGAVGVLAANPGWRDLNNTPTAYRGWQTIREGVAQGRLVGGNSISFIQLLHTDYELRYPKEILFVETYRQSKKQVHKTFMQLKLHGVLDNINGLVVGYCLESDNPDVVGNDRPIADVVREITQGYTFPIMQIGEIGHHVENFLQPIGALAHLDAGARHFEILERVAE